MTWLQGRIVERGSQGWKELRRSLVQPCAHSRLSSEVRPGLQLVRDENLQGWKLHDLSRKPVPLPDCPHGGIFFFLICNLNHSCFSLFSLPLIFLPSPTSGRPSPSHRSSPHRHWGLLSGYAGAVSAPSWMHPAPPASPRKVSAQEGQ